MQFVKNWLAERRFNKMIKTAKEFGLSPVRIVRRGNTECIVTPDGQYLRIGKGK